MNERTIFENAIDLTDPAERAAYLNEACGQDVKVRSRIEALLRSNEQAGSFLQGGVVPIETVDILPIAEKPGTQIGPYKLLQQIGEGGMGVVYMAEQKQPIKRRVALKIIKPGMDTRQVIARFEAERQALAMMDHPNIAKVLDASETESGRPYFVMELVNGISVTQFCDEQHLTPKERLELFVPICQAVQHAHQKGIIHRDLKPSNVLVALYDGQAVPKVIDFGVAKATGQTLTEKTMFTQLGQIIGTLEYMSPEQAQRNQLDVDTRSDIYSMGVLLYELLTGDTPFDRTRLRSAAFDEMLRIIREEEPSKPSTKVSNSESLPSIAANRRIDAKKLSTTIRGELDWIVMKALEKDRSRRYESASSLAEDINRYLNDETVLARQPSKSYRLKKFVRRHRSLIFLVTSTILVLVSALIGVSWQASVAAEQRDRAIQAEAKASHYLDQSLETVDVMLTHVADEKLKDVPFMEDVRRSILEEALRFQEQFLADNPNDPDRVLEMAKATRRVARILGDLGRYDESIDTIQAAVSLLRPNQARRPRDAESLDELARCLILQYEVTPRHQANAASERRLLAEAIDILENLSKSSPNRTDVQLRLANAYQQLGGWLRIQGQLGDAGQWFKKANDIHRSLYEQSKDDSPQIAISYAESLGETAGWLGDRGKATEAVEHYELAEQFLRPHRKSVGAARDIEFELAKCMLGRGMYLSVHLGRHDDAEPILREAVAILQKLVDDFPSLTSYRQALSYALGNLGALLTSTNRQRESTDCSKQAIEHLEKIVVMVPRSATFQSDLGAACHNLAVSHLATGDLPETQVRVEQAIRHQQIAHDIRPDAIQPLMFLRNHYGLLGKVLYKLREPDRAREAYQEAIRLAKKCAEKVPARAGTVKTIIDELQEFENALNKPTCN